MRKLDHMRRGRQRHAGYSLLEVGLAIGITALALASMNSITVDASTQIRDAAAADRLKEVYTAAQRYISNSTVASTLISSTALNASTAIVVGRTTAAAGVPAGSLQALGYLPASFIDANSFGQHHLVVARHVQDASGNDALDLLVEQVGGRVIPDLDLGRISSKIGAPGGSVMTKAPVGIAAGTIQGTGGGWAQAATTWTAGGVTPQAGHAMAVAYANQTTMLADFLYRNKITGVPEANTMHASINVNANQLNNAAQIDNGAGVLALGSTVAGTAGGPVNVQNGINGCYGTTGSNFAANCEVAISSAGGFYTTPGDNQIHFSAINSAGGLSLSGGPGENLYVGGGTESNGIIRADSNVSMKANTRITWPDAASGSPSGGLGVDSDNYYHFYNTGLRVDNDIYGTGNIVETGNGNIIAQGNGNANTGNVAAKVFYDIDNLNYYVDPNGTSMINSMQAAGSLSAQGYSPTANYPTDITGGGVHTGNLYAETAIAVGKRGTGAAETVFNANGTGHIGGILTVDNQVNLPAIATSGAACAPNGAIAANKSGSGSQMTCFNGIWVATATTAAVSSYTIPNGYPGDVNFNMGAHFYCALSDTAEYPNLPQYAVPTAIRINVIGYDASNRPQWAMSRGSGSPYGGAAYCIDY